MAGYHGWSMSNNAILAYENDEKPLSSWTKDDILDAIESAVESEELELKCNIDKLRKMSAVDLKDICLQYTSWHHTGKYFKETNFYSLDFTYLESLTDETLDVIVAEAKEERRERRKLAEEEKREKGRRCEASYLEWYGTRKHPKAKEVIEEGIVKGNWFYMKNGKKKSIYGKGFRIIKYLDDQNV